MSVRSEPEPMSRSEQAADWCRRIAESSLSKEEARAFEAWVEAGEENRRAFDRATLIWRTFDGRAAPPELVKIRLDALGALHTNARDSGTSSRRISRAGWSIAASVAVVAIALTATLFLSGRSQTYATGVGERRVVALQDGSRVSLDAASRVEVSYSNTGRSLLLRAGRAKFDVAKDPLRPFSVTAADRIVVATGTSFSVEMVAKRVEVVLYEGQVSVLRKQPDGPPTPIASPSVLAAADVGRTLSWEAGQLTFIDEPLELAVERMNRYASVALQIEDATAASVPISGVFNASDTEAFLDGVTSIFPLHARRQGDAIVLSSARR